jgi:hypothetical protein
MKRKMIISSAMCAAMIATTALPVCAAQVNYPEPTTAQVNIHSGDSNSYTLIELMDTDDWEVLFNYVDENASKGIYIKKYSEAFKPEAAISITAENIDDPIDLATGEYTLVDGNGNIIPCKPSNSTFSVYSPGKYSKGRVISKFYFSLATGPRSEQKGDVNNDGKIDVTDIIKIAAHIKSEKFLQDDKQKYRADVNNDDKIDVTDIVKVAAHIKGKKPLSKA